MAAPNNIMTLIQNARIHESLECTLFDNGMRGCYFCRRTLQNTCYAFVQLREHYDRNILFLACNDQCPVAMHNCAISKCRNCHRNYLHMRYDNDVCVHCADENANINIAA